MNVVTFIVDRLHVGTSNRQVLREIRSRLRKGMRRGRKHRMERRLAYQIALDRHAANRKTYHQVMSGNFN